MFFQKHNAIRRIDFLIPDEDFQFEVEKKEKLNSKLDLYLQKADIKLRPIVFILINVICCAVICFGLSKYLAAYFIPIIALSYVFLVYLLLEKRADNRSLSFSVDYPTVLMATASSVKAGLTPYAALERSINLLPINSLVRQEVSTLLKKIRSGEPKKNALAEFGNTIRQPDLELFREAFLIVLEHGGRFAPTLERLASVCRDRSSLIRSARVSTASMRMTANVLLVVAPLVVLLIALRTKNFWEILFSNSVANTLGSAGIIIILLSYGILIKMSSFKP